MRKTVNTEGFKDHMTVIKNFVSDLFEIFLSLDLELVVWVESPMTYVVFFRTLDLGRVAVTEVTSKSHSRSSVSNCAVFIAVRVVNIYSWTRHVCMIKLAVPSFEFEHGIISLFNGLLYKHGIDRSCVKQPAIRRHRSYCPSSSDFPELRRLFLRGTVICFF